MKNISKYSNISMNTLICVRSGGADCLTLYVSFNNSYVHLFEEEEKHSNIQKCICFAYQNISMITLTCVRSGGADCPTLGYHLFPRTGTTSSAAA